MRPWKHKLWRLLSWQACILVKYVFGGELRRPAKEGGQRNRDECQPLKRREDSLLTWSSGFVSSSSMPAQLALDPASPQPLHLQHDSVHASLYFAARYRYRLSLVALRVP